MNIVYKCRMCGGNLEIEEGGKTAVCEYCLTKQPIPSTDDEKLAGLYVRADHFRLDKQFDKAMGIYEHIAEEDPNEPEVHWAIMLCRFGIDYVEDAVTHVLKPTIHRTQMKSVLKDPDYIMATELADPVQREFYVAQARQINVLQKEIINIVEMEQPYDIFISFKDTMEGKRTQSSLLAENLYDILTQEGYRVFYSRISLENVVGEKYEPYIYAALNSAKVMLVVGRSREEFMSPWVHNEWSRFLSMSQDTDKKVYPCFRDMDPYDLPDEFQILQCQDMDKIGFEKDLLKGIKKVLDKKKTQPNPMNANNGGGSATITSLLDRASICIQDGDYKKTDQLLDQVLNINPREGKAYLFKLMLDFQVGKMEELADASQPLSISRNYQHVLEFCDQETAEYVKKANEEIFRKNTEYADKTIDEKIRELNVSINSLNKGIEKTQAAAATIQGEIEDKQAEKEFTIMNIRKRTRTARKVGIILVCLAVFFIILSFKSWASENNGLAFLLFVLSVVCAVIGSKASSVKGNYSIGDNYNGWILQRTADYKKVEDSLKKLTDERTRHRSMKTKIEGRRDDILNELIWRPRGTYTKDDVQ